MYIMWIADFFFGFWVYNFCFVFKIFVIIMCVNFQWVNAMVSIEA